MDNMASDYDMYVEPEEYKNRKRSYMETYKGVVQKIVNNAKNYGILMDDDNWYSTFTKPVFDEGDMIQFSFKANKTARRTYYNIVEDSEEVVAKGNGDDAEATNQARPKPNPQKAPAKQGKTVTKDDYWTNKAADDKRTQRAIRYQASRNAAIEMADLLLKNELVSLGNSKAKKVGIVEDLVETYTNDFYNKTLDVQEMEGHISAGNVSDNASTPDNEVEGGSEDDYE